MSVVGTVTDAMREPPRRTIVHEEAGDGDGWVVADITQVRGCNQLGQPDGARNVIKSCSRPGSVQRPSCQDCTDSDSLKLMIAA